MQKLQTEHNYFTTVMGGYKSPKIVKRKDYVRKDGYAAISLQVIFKSKKLLIPLGLSARDEDWDEVNCRFKKSADKSGDYNLILDQAKSKATEIFLEYRLADKPLNASLFQDLYNNFEVRKDFIVFMEKAIENRSAELSDKTKAQHLNTARKLRLFRPNIAFYELDTILLDQFNIWMKKLKNNNNTRHKDFSNLSTYINIAIDKYSIRIENPFKKWKKPEATDRFEFLTKEEIKIFYDAFNHPLCCAKDKKYLRLWLLMMSTGLRIGDALTVRKDQILHSSLIFVPEKNKKKGKMLSVPLTKMAMQFINPEGDLIGLPVTAAAAREGIKAVAVKLGIKKVLNNHMARHTFATQFLLNGGNILTLQKILGHKDISDTMRYEHITQEYKSDSMNAAFDLFYAELIK